MTPPRSLAAAVALVIAAAVGFVRPVPAVAAAPLRSGQVGDVVDVALDPTRAGPSSAPDIARSVSGTLVSVVGAGTSQPVAVVRVAPGSSPVAAVRAKRDQRVAWAEPDAEVHAADEPNDPCYGPSPGCPNFGVNQNDLKLMHASAAWSVTHGDPNMAVAVLDTRVDTTSVDLQGKVTVGPIFQSGTAPCSATGFPDHGTMVTGVIAADTNNGVGLAALGWDTRALSIQVLDDCGNGLASDVARGVDAAVAAGARVINMSLAGEGTSTLLAATNRATHAGAVLVAAAGNSGMDPLSTPTTADDSYPALYPGVLGVAATTKSDTLASYSDFGPWIPLAAPGDAIYSTAPAPGEFGVQSGTSAAAPHVAAVAALMLAANPNLTGPEVAVKLEQTAVPIAGTGTKFRYGRVDAGAAVASAIAPKPAQGYRLVASDGGIFAFGAETFLGSTAGSRLNRPVVAAAATPDHNGYWMAASDGGMFSFGNAAFYGSTGGITLNKPIVAMTPTPTGKGYWLAASDGGIFAFGDAGFFGSTGGISLNKPIVAMAASPTGAGYWLVASDGGVFTFGDAGFFGSTGSIALNRPIVGMAATPTGNGYLLLASDGGMFTFGDARFFGSTGSTPLNKPIVAMSVTPSTGGYWLVASDGGIFAFGDAQFFGSTGSTPLNQPIIGTA